MFGFAQPVRCLQGRNDGKVVADLGIVKNALALDDVVTLERRCRMGGQVLHGAAGKHLEGLLDHRQIVFRQRARIGTRIGQCLVAFVQALCDRQRGLGGVTKLAVGFALQTGQVEQQGGGLRRRLAFFRDTGLLTPHGISDGARFALAPEAIGLEFGIRLLRIAGRQIGSSLFPGRIKPFAVVLSSAGAKDSVHLKVVATDEFANLLFALNHHTQGRRLHTTHCRQEEATVA